MGTMTALLMFHSLLGAELHEPQTSADYGEPTRGIERTQSAHQPNILPLGQTGSHSLSSSLMLLYVHRHRTDY